MAENPTREALEELLDYLEEVETQSGALLAFLRHNGIVTQEKLAPYRAQAANATAIKSEAIRARFDFLFNSEQTSKSAAESNPVPPNERPMGAPGQRESNSTQPQQSKSKAPKSPTEEAA